MLALLRRVTVFKDARDQHVFLSGLANVRKPTVLSFINQHGFNLAYDDQQLCDALIASDYVLRDGAGIEIGLKLLGLPSGVNSCGTDVIPQLLQRMAGRKIVVFGTRDPWLSEACSIISTYGLTVVAAEDGFHSNDRYLEVFLATQPDIALLAMGMPKQELLSIRLRNAARSPCLIINGGAVADFLSGRFPRAPVFVRAIRLEWLFRLICEPRRLASRYLTGGVLFAVRLAKVRRQVRRIERAGTG